MKIYDQDKQPLPDGTTVMLYKGKPYTNVEDKDVLFIGSVKDGEINYSGEIGKSVNVRVRKVGYVPFERGKHINKNGLSVNFKPDQIYIPTPVIYKKDYIHLIAQWVIDKFRR